MLIFNDFSSDLKMDKFVWQSWQRAASDTGGPGFESSYSVTFIEQLVTINCLWKKLKRKNMPGKVHFKNIMHV